MDQNEFQIILKELRLQGSELQKYEAKASHTGLPKKLIRSLSSFANQEDGGTILLGIGDAPDFEVVGVRHVDELQSQVATLIQDRLCPVPKVKIETVDYKSKQVLVIKVYEIDYTQKPCYDKKEGIHGGSFKRVGDQDHYLSPYEIFLLQSQNIRPKDDIKPIKAYYLEGLEESVSEKLKNYIKLIKDKTRSSYLLKLEDLELLKARHIIKENMLTLMSVLVFEDYPQRFFPKLRITFLSYESNEVQAASRYLDNKVFEGSFIEILETTLNYLKLQLPQSYCIEGSSQKITVQIPEVALREALINAMIHRDFSDFALSREIQIRLTPSKLVIENPGGLFGGVRIDSLKSHQSIPRNAHLATLAEDMGYIENRGDGILAMCSVCRQVGLPEPIFENFIDSFRVTFLRSSQKSDLEDSSSEERFLKKYKKFTRSDVIRSLGFTIGEAKYFIKKQLEAGRIEQHGERKGTFYKVQT